MKREILEIDIRWLYIAAVGIAIQTLLARDAGMLTWNNWTELIIGGGGISCFLLAFDCNKDGAILKTLETMVGFAWILIAAFE
jgi:hypothetical protein